MKKKQAKLHPAKSVISQLDSKDEKPSRSLKAVCKNKLSVQNEHEHSMESSVHFAHEKYNDQKFIDQLSDEEVDKIFNASAYMDYNRANLENEYLLPTGLPDSNSLAGELEVIEYIQNRAGKKNSLFKKFNFACLSGVNLSIILMSLPYAIKFVPREDLCRISVSDRLSFLASHPEYASYLLPDLPASDIWVTVFCDFLWKKTKVLVKFAPWDGFNFLQRRYIIAKVPRFAKYLSK